MACPSSFSVFLSLFMILVLFSPVVSLTCTTQTFSNNRVYPNCQDLPVLDSYLHSDFDFSNSSLSIAFIASPAQPGGWVSWAINPTGTGMAGAQALIAYQNDGVMTVKTYDIRSYDSIVPGKLSFDVWDMMAEESEGLMKIFAKVKVPEKAQSLNQVWQVGSSVTGGRPDMHSFEPANMNAKGILNLTSSQIFNNGSVDERKKNKNTTTSILRADNNLSYEFAALNPSKLMNRRKTNSFHFQFLSRLFFLPLPHTNTTMPSPSSFSIFLSHFMISVLFSQVASLTCTTQKFSNNRVYPNCQDLPVLDSYFHWDYDSSSSSLSIAFVAAPAQPGGWVSWAINPTGTGMTGAQALIAFQNDGVMTVKTYDIRSYSSIVPGILSIDVWDMMAEESEGLMRIFAKVKVPEKAQSLNQVWQVGSSITDGKPDMHSFAPANMNAKGILSLNSSQIFSNGGVDERTTKKNIHGILNTVSWGILFPTGVIIARYMKTFPAADPLWFNLHVSSQFSAYAIGVAGWATGLSLGYQSEGIQYSIHRNIGIALFSLATFQMMSALFLRPKKDHKYRKFWNAYHYTAGYSIIVMGIINIFKGFEILQPQQKWKTAYIAVITALGGIAVVLEVFTWIIVLRRKSNQATKPSDEFNGQNRQLPLAI